MISFSYTLIHYFSSLWGKIQGAITGPDKCPLVSTIVAPALSGHLGDNGPRYLYMLHNVWPLKYMTESMAKIQSIWLYTSHFNWWLFSNIIILKRDSHFPGVFGLKRPKREVKWEQNSPSHYLMLKTIQLSWLWTLLILLLLSLFGNL